MQMIVRGGAVLGILLVIVVLLVVEMQREPLKSRQAKEAKERKAPVKYTEFNQLIAAARAQAAAIMDSEMNAGYLYTAAIPQVDVSAYKMLFEVYEKGDGKTTTSQADVYWKLDGDVWRVDHMTSDWEDIGFLSVSAPQLIVDRICYQLDSQYTPPKSDPQKTAETWEALNQFRSSQSATSEE